MGAIAARELRSVLDLSETVLVLTLLACAQATDALGGPSNIPELLRIIYERIRVISPPMLLDRALDVEIAALVDAYRAGALGLEVPTFASAGVA